MHWAEKLAQDLTAKNGKPVAVNRAGLMIMAIALGEVVGVKPGDLEEVQRCAKKVLEDYYKEQSK